MPRLFTGKKLVLATHNKGKQSEFKALLAPLGVEVTSAGELGLPEPEETGATFEENSLVKSRAASEATGLPALADDSGLCVNALGGNPGLFSARWCGPDKDPIMGMTRVHEELGDNPDRTAYFICVLALVWPDGHYEMVEGRCEGEIVWPPRGDQGHGYDPFFLPIGETATFGELSAAKKQELSHRGCAVAKLLRLFACE